MLIFFIFRYIKYVEFSRKDFKQESREVLKYCQGIHHSRKNAHSQSNYPSTVEKLSHFQSNVPIAFKPLPSGIPPQEKPVTQYRVMKESEFMDSMKSNLNNETFINGRKRYYNMQVGRKAVVNEVRIFSVKLSNLFPVLLLL